MSDIELYIENAALKKENAELVKMIKLANDTTRGYQKLYVESEAQNEKLFKIAEDAVAAGKEAHRVNRCYCRN